MTSATAAPTFIREGFRTVTPYLVSSRGPEVLEFVKQAYGATETMRNVGGMGGMHAEVRLGDTMLMIGGGLEFKGADQTCSLHFHVPDVDATYRRAIELGATTMGYEPTDHEYGERGAGVKDVAGNIWYLATVKGESFHWPGIPQVQPFFHVNGAAAFLDFLANAFGGVIEGKHERPDGKVAHGMVRLGTSVIEASDAVGPYQPLPSMLYMYVEDCDALFQRALNAGATVLNPVADQPYGDRNGAVTDPFGNIWYIGTHKGLPAR